MALVVVVAVVLFRWLITYVHGSMLFLATINSAGEVIQETDHAPDCAVRDTAVFPQRASC